MSLRPVRAQIPMKVKPIWYSVVGVDLQHRPQRRLADVIEWPEVSHLQEHRGLSDSANQCYVTSQNNYFSFVGYFLNFKSSCHYIHWTSVSEMIRKPLLVKAQTALKKIKDGKKKFNMADETITPCNAARSWHWFHQVTAPCNVAYGSGIIAVSKKFCAQPIRSVLLLKLCS